MGHQQRPAIVHVVGSLNRDTVLRVDHLPRSGETITSADVSLQAGGKGLNQAVAAARAGAVVSLLGAVGGDDAGEGLLSTLAAAGVDVSAIEVVTERTGEAIVVVEQGGENLIIVLPGANHAISADAVDRLRPRSGSVVVAQLEVPLPIVAGAMAAARASGAIALLNAAPALPLPDEVLAAAEILVVNETELDALGGVSAVLARLGPRGSVVATLGAAGALVADGTGETAIAGRDVPVVDTTGAGDCFVGVLAAGLAAGNALTDAVGRANRAASVAVQRPGAAASMPSIAEVDALDS